MAADTPQTPGWWLIALDASDARNPASSSPWRLARVIVLRMLSLARAMRRSAFPFRHGAWGVAGS
eukprot:3633845-Lingulodinium_polyedra.AAC.1